MIMDSKQPKDYSPLSSGRWDASGSWKDAVYLEYEKAFKWASSLSTYDLHWAVTMMADDVNAYSLYERKAILQVVALYIGKDIRRDF